MVIIHFIFALISSVLAIACFVPYIRDIFLHKTKPHSYSWLIWAIVETTAVAAMLSAGAAWGSATLVIGAVLCTFIFLLSLSYGTKNITLFDTICLVGALSASAIYLFLHNSFLSVVLAALIDFVAFLPTFRKMLQEPKTETVSTYFLSSFSSIFALGALRNFNFITSFYLITIIATNFSCAVIILIRRR